MFASADKTTRHSQVQQKAADPAAFLQRKAEPAFFGGNKQNDTFFSPSAVIQAKLSISQPNDPHEREADAVAERVMTMPEPAAVAAPVTETEKDVQKQEEEQAPMPAMEISPHIQCKDDPKEEEKKIAPKLSDTILRKEEDTGEGEKEQAVPSPSFMITIDRKIRGPCRLYRHTTDRAGPRQRPTIVLKAACKAPKEAVRLCLTLRVISWRTGLEPTLVACAYIPVQQPFS